MTIPTFFGNVCQPYSKGQHRGTFGIYGWARPKPLREDVTYWCVSARKTFLQRVNNGVIFLALIRRYVASFVIHSDLEQPKLEYGPRLRKHAIGHKAIVIVRAVDDLSPCYRKAVIGTNNNSSVIWLFSPLDFPRQQSFQTSYETVLNICQLYFIIIFYFASILTLPFMICAINRMHYGPEVFFAWW